MEHDRRAGELYQSEDYEGALREMMAAQELLPATPRVYNIASCHERMGNLSEALVFFQRFVELEDAPPERRERARERITEIREQMAAEAAATDEPTSSDGDGGEDDGAGSVGAGEGAEEPVAPSTTDRRTLGPGLFWGLAGVAAATGIAAIVTGALTLSWESEFNAMDRGEGTNLQDKGRDLALVTDILIGVAAASAVAAIVVAFFTRFGEDEPASSSGVSLSAGPLANGLALGLSGRF